MSRVKDGVFSGFHGPNHLQGIAVDTENDRIYWSFTTMLIATRLDGTPVGSAGGLTGHLGCICLNRENGLVYGSLEFKHDSIGKGIAGKIGADTSFDDGFYIAVFDGLKITRENMNASDDGIMTAAFLPEVLNDYNGRGAHLKKHRFGCSGIDGTTFAPLPGKTDGRTYLYVAYGIYRDKSRRDNDCQVILRYDPEEIRHLSMPLYLNAMHRSGPAAPLSKYYVYTGNTDWGIQNLSYDETRKLMLAAVYPGNKPEFENYGMFAVDMTVPPVTATVPGTRVTGEMLTLAGADGITDKKRPGLHSRFGQYGMPAFPDGSFLIAEPGSKDGENFAYLYNYRFSYENGFEKENTYDQRND